MISDEQTQQVPRISNVDSFLKRPDSDVVKKLAEGFNYPSTRVSIGRELIEPVSTHAIRE